MKIFGRSTGADGSEKFGSYGSFAGPTPAIQVAVGRRRWWIFVSTRPPSIPRDLGPAATFRREDQIRFDIIKSLSHGRFPLRKQHIIGVREHDGAVTRQFLDGSQRRSQLLTQALPLDAPAEHSEVQAVSYSTF